MNLVMLGFVAAAAVIYGFTYATNPKYVTCALPISVRQLFHPQHGFAYIIVSAFLISSLLVLVLPKEQIAAWLGKESGLRGIVLGTALGALTPGGPFLSFPILVSFWKAGASIGTVIAYLSAWSLFRIHRVLVWELPFFGPKFVLMRIALSLAVPVVLGIAGQWLLGAVKPT